MMNDAVLRKIDLNLLLAFSVLMQERNVSRAAERLLLGQPGLSAALKRLRELNIITWVRRSEDDYDEDGRYRLRQSTNAYATIKPSLWDGGGDLDPPDPPRDTLGFPPPIPSQLDQAAAALASGDRKELLRQLELDPHDRIATALASWAKDFPQD